MMNGKDKEVFFAGSWLLRLLANILRISSHACGGG